MKRQNIFIVAEYHLVTANLDKEYDRNYNEHSGALLFDIASPENLSTEHNDRILAKCAGYAAHPPEHRVRNEARSTQSYVGINYMVTATAFSLVGIVPDDADGFSRGSPVYSTLSFRCCSILHPHRPSNLDIKSHPNLFTQSCRGCGLHAVREHFILSTARWSYRGAFSCAWRSGQITCFPPRRAGFYSRRGRSRIFARGTMPLAGRFSRGSPVSPALAFHRCSILTSPTTTETLARLARRSDKALGVRVTVARIAPSLLDLGRAVTLLVRRGWPLRSPDFPCLNFSLMGHRENLVYETSIDLDEDLVTGSLWLLEQFVSIHHAIETKMLVFHQEEPGTIPGGVTHRIRRSYAATSWYWTTQCTTARDDRHLVGMPVTDIKASSTVLAGHWSTTTGVDLSASTVRHHLLQAQQMASMPLRRLPWQNVVFSDESRFNLSYNDGGIRVRRYRGDRNLAASIVEQHSGQAASVMVWGAIGYNMRSKLLGIEGNLNGNCYTREVLDTQVLPLLQASPHAIFQQYNVHHMWRGMCRPSSMNDGYYCFSGLHIRLTCYQSNMSGIWLVGDLFVTDLQQLLLVLCGLSHKPPRLKSAMYLRLFWRYEKQKRGSYKDDTDPCTYHPSAFTRKVLKWRAVFLLYHLTFPDVDLVANTSNIDALTRGFCRKCSNLVASLLEPFDKDATTDHGLNTAISVDPQVEGKWFTAGLTTKSPVKAVSKGTESCIRPHALPADRVRDSCSRHRLKMSRQPELPAPTYTTLRDSSRAIFHSPNRPTCACPRRSQCGHIAALELLNWGHNTPTNPTRRNLISSQRKGRIFQRPANTLIVQISSGYCEHCDIPSSCDVVSVCGIVVVGIPRMSSVSNDDVLLRIKQEKLCVWDTANKRKCATFGHSIGLNN
ncbi:hypothetical protein PR048_019076 [Dryococelus australis]|uniref:PiggyBac transposable element-derived protein domain-containing protein n=1 Tax=Dryococelus australis TaxID=614101 RepID=A0ABQ9H2T6_9NEOP|nr:hypothetical protein PR048_019076 [Dryococelus australis]